MQAIPTDSCTQAVKPGRGQEPIGGEGDRETAEGGDGWQEERWMRLKLKVKRKRLSGD